MTHQSPSVNSSSASLECSYASQVENGRLKEVKVDDRSKSGSFEPDWTVICLKMYGPAR